MATTVPQEDKMKALSAALSQIEKQFGKGSVMRLGDHAETQDPQVVSTGSLGLDIALGVGGLPRGRVVEIYGPESSGKTTLSLRVVAGVQKAGGTAAYIGAESGGFALAKGFSSTGLSDFLGDQLSGLSSVSPILVIIITATLVTFLTELTSNTALTQTILPIVASVSVAIGMNPLLLMLTATISASMAFMLPVATPPNTIIFAGGRIKILEMAKTGFVLNIIGVIIISLMVYYLGNLIFGLNTFPVWANP